MGASRIVNLARFWMADIMRAKKAWMDEEIMNKWIDLVLVPWKNSKALGVIPIIILDAYCVHMMGTIAKQIQLLWIKVVHIPP